MDRKTLFRAAVVRTISRSMLQQYLILAPGFNIVSFDILRLSKVLQAYLKIITRKSNVMKTDNCVY
jgi:hypothetical protein